MDSKPMVSLPRLDTKEVDNNANLNGNATGPMGAAASSSQILENAGQRRVSVTRGLHGGGVPNSAQVNRLNAARNLQISTANVRINDQLSQSNGRHSKGAAADEFLHLEDYDANLDAEFVKDELVPYLRDLYKDLLMRSNQQEHVDKVTFIEYTKLPGIINDRLHVMFSENYNKNGCSPTQAVSSLSKGMSRESMSEKKKHEYVTMQSFIQNFTDIFIGDLNKKMRFTFNMYDFDGDGYITPEDIRIMLSYMPFKRNIQIQNVQSMLDSKGMENLSPLLLSLRRDKEKQTPSRQSRPINRPKQREGLYQDEEGKNVDYRDRVSDQEDIRMFTENIFNNNVSGCTSKHMSYKHYEYVNYNISSEMFYSLMAVLHERLPCAQGFFRLKKKYRDMHFGEAKASSPVRKIASPKMIRGLSITKNQRKEQSSNGESLASSPQRISSPDIRIKNVKQSELSRRQSINSRIKIGSAGNPNKKSIISGVHTPLKNGLGSDIDDFDAVRKESELASITQSDFKSNAPKSPHKIVRGHKLRRYEESKQSVTISNMYNDEHYKEFERNFSPINSQKTFGVRIGVGNKGKQAAGGTLLSSNLRNQMGASPTEKSRSSLRMDTYPQAFNQTATEGFVRKTGEESAASIPNAQQQEVEPLQGFGDYEAHEERAFEGQCFLKTKTDRYKEHWAVMAGNELYCYRQQTDHEHRVMHSLIGTFIKEMPTEESQSEGCQLFPVKIVLPPNKSRILYFKCQNQQQDWLLRLRQVVGYANLFDYYNFEDNLGKGQFGLVKLATHTKTGKKVAIKTIHKKDMKPIEIYQQRREIDVLKMSQHPNIVGLIDLFENSDYYYIVLEYMQGKDLFDYIQYRNFKLSEARVKELSYQIGIAIKYLHSYGIVHRDLKLENVMMSDNSESSVPKLVDFGLAKMIGPNEKADEPFGTLGYVAPEVLRKEPYSFSCDLWSFGCIIYALLSGSLPFDHESQKETIKMTLENKLEFDLPCWEQITEECKDLLTKLLCKESKKRISLDSALKHKWFEGIDLNHKTGFVNNKNASQQFKQKKLNISEPWF